MFFVCFFFGLSSFVIGYREFCDDSYTYLDPPNRIADGSCNRIMDMTGKEHSLSADNIDHLCAHDHNYQDFWPKLTTKDELHSFTDWILNQLPKENQIKFWIDLHRVDGSGKAQWKWPRYKRKGFPEDVQSGWNLRDDMTGYWAIGQPSPDTDQNCAYSVVSRLEKSHVWYSRKCNESLNVAYYICQRVSHDCHDCKGSGHQAKGSFILICLIAIVVGMIEAM